MIAFDPYCSNNENKVLYEHFFIKVFYNHKKQHMFKLQIINFQQANFTINKETGA